MDVQNEYFLSVLHFGYSHIDDKIERKNIVVIITKILPYSDESRIHVNSAGLSLSHNSRNHAESRPAHRRCKLLSIELVLLNLFF